MRVLPCLTRFQVGGILARRSSILPMTIFPGLVARKSPKTRSILRLLGVHLQSKLHRTGQLEILREK